MPALILKRAWVLFTAIVLAFFLSNGIAGILKFEPSGIHFIRQTDSASFADNYYYGKYPFAEPRTWSLLSEEGKAACEFPLLYYITALLRHYADSSSSILRTIVWLISMLGFVSAYSLINRLSQQPLTSIPLAIISLGSTIVLYYSSVPMVDGAALGLVLIGLNLVHFCEESARNPLLLFAGIVAVTLGALLKITFAIVPIGWLLGSIVNTFNQGVKGLLPQFNKTLISTVILLIFSIFSVLGWYTYAIQYNDKSGDDYFLTSSRDVFSISGSDIFQISDIVLFRWKQAIFPNESWIIIIALLAISICFYKRIVKLHRYRLVASAAGVLCYILLFFEQFRDHDYYFLPLIPFFVYLIGLSPWKQIAPNKKWFLYLSFIVFTTTAVSSINYSSYKWLKRYQNPEMKFSSASYSLIRHQEKIASTIGKDPIIVVGDPTRNGSLYFLKHRGYTFSNWPQFFSYNKKLEIGSLPILCNELPDENFLGDRNILFLGRWKLISPQ